MDERLHLERVAGLDIGKATLEACVMVSAKSNPARRAQEVRNFGTTKKGSILLLAAWLHEHQVQVVAMESTSDYWRAPFFRLEAEGLSCGLLDAKQVKALPGRPKTDKADCVWLAKVAERGMAAKCFVPPKEIRQLRTLTHYRRHLTEERSREKARAEKLLEDAMVKLSVVVSELHGVSSRAMMEALIGGCRDPNVLAEMARGRLRSKMGALEEAPDGADSFSDQHAFVLQIMIDNSDRLSAQIERLTAQIDQLIAAFERQVAQLDAVPGFGRVAAQDLIAEVGVDMSVIPTAAHLASWSKYCPQVKQSAGTAKGRNSRGKGNRYLSGLLGEATVSAGRTQTRIATRYRRLSKRRGQAKAQVATGNTLLTIAHALLSDPTADYHDLGPDWYEAHNQHRR